MMVLAQLWRTVPRALLAVTAAWLTLAVAQPLLAWSLQRLVETSLAADLGPAIAAAAAAAAAVAVLGQALYQSYLLRIEILDRGGLQLTSRVLDAVTRRPGLTHLEDARSLDRIRVALEGWAVVGAVTGGAQLVAVVAGLVLTVPLLGASAGVALALIPLCAPLVLAAIWSFRIRLRGAESAADADRAAERVLLVAFDPAAACELRIAGTVPALLEEYGHQHRRATRMRVRSQLHAAGVLAVAWVLFLIGFTVILGSIVATADDAPATVIPLIAVSLQLQGIAVVMVNGSTEIVRGRQVRRAQHEAIGAPGGRAAPASVPVPVTMRRGIRLRDVGFTYPGAAAPALAHLDLDLAAGTVVAVVGAHGSGKSTLAKLLLRLYEPDHGAIELDGAPLADLDVDAWRQRTSACFQDFLRVPGPLSESIGIGDLRRIDDHVAIGAALSRAGGDRLRESLPAGIATVLGPSGLGADLSGGQWQRVALARAFLRPDPLLLVLDEPTASFDPIAEKQLFDSNIDFARRVGATHGTITLAIAHRYATVQNADLIVVLDAGRLREVGTHAELLRRDGLYAAAYQQQRAAHV